MLVHDGGTEQLFESGRVRLERCYELSEADPKFLRRWTNLRAAVEERAGTDSGFFNGASIVVNNIDIVDDDVTIQWFLGDYLHLLTAIEASQSENVLPQISAAPLWARCTGMSICAPLLSVDGLVWARRSSKVRTFQGLWQPGSAEGTELADLESEDWLPAAQRGLQEEFGVSGVTLLGAFLQLRTGAETLKLRWWLPTASNHTFDEVSTLQACAVDSWENDALACGDTPPGQVAFPIPCAVWDTLTARTTCSDYLS